MNRRELITRTSFHALVLAGAAVFVAGTSVAHAQTKEINFGIISTESSANLKTSWQPLIDDMEKRTGLAIKPFFASDYAGIIEAMRFNKVQVAWMGNKSAMEAVDRSQGEVFAKVKSENGSDGYWSLLIVNKDSPYKSLDDVLAARKELNLGMGDPNSTSGSLVPSYYIFSKHKLDPAKDFKRAVRSNHESNILAVVNKQLDTATVASDALDRMELKMPEKAAQVRIVWKSPLIASDPLVWRKDLDAATKKNVDDFFLGYGKDEREKEILRKLTFSGFTRSDNNQLLPIRQLELARDRTKVEADANLSAEDKAAKLKAIDGQLDELSRKVASAS